VAPREPRAGGRRRERAGERLIVGEERIGRAAVHPHREAAKTRRTGDHVVAREVVGGIERIAPTRHQVVVAREDRRAGRGDTDEARGMLLRGEEAPYPPIDQPTRAIGPAA
jgi:hypothetical protein